VTREPRSAFALLGFAISVFVVSFPLMVVALRDFGPATATLVRMLAAAAVLALAARGSFDALRGSVGRIAVVGALGLGVQSWLLAYAMTHVGGALPALVLGLEPILIGLVGSLVVNEHVGLRLCVAFGVGLVGEAVIAGFVTAGVGERPLLPLAALAGVVTLFSAYSVSLRDLAALPSAALVCVSSLGGAVAMLPLVAIELARGENLLGRDRHSVAWFDSPTVSRRHARIVVTADQAILEDLGSRNGTWIGGKRITGPVPLSDLDEVKLGSLVMLFRILEETETQSGSGS